MKKLFCAFVALAALSISANAQVDTSIYRDAVSQDPINSANRILELRLRQQQIELQQLEIQRREMQLQQLRLQHQEMKRGESQLQQQKQKPQSQKQIGRPLHLHRLSDKDEN